MSKSLEFPLFARRLWIWGIFRMYAVIKTGGKQYRVSKGATLKVEKIEADEGSTIEFDQVLMVSDGKNVSIGTPVIDGSVVTAKVVGQGKSRKVEVIKFKRRKNYKRNVGHRQMFTEVEITGITAGKGKSAAAEKPAASATKKAASKPAAKKATSKKTTAKKAVAKKAPAKKAASKKSAE